MTTTERDAATPRAEASAAPREGGAPDNDTLSTIMRFHRRERIGFLEEALFSLAIQSWPDHETVIVIQNGTEEVVADIVEIINRQPWPAAPRYQIFSVEIPPGVDGRSTLLTRGIERASGRYIAFLDDDDLVYQHCYAALVRQLKAGGCAVAVGGCRTARVRQVSGSWYVNSKESPFTWGRTRTDLLRDNFIPIHSYVVDRARVDVRDLYFDDELPPLEDYDFLLRLCTKYDFDFSLLDTFVCEYRIHGLNSIPYDAAAPQSAHDKHLRAQKLIEERKKALKCAVPVPELLELHARLAEREARLGVLEQAVAGYEREKRERFLLRLAWKVYEFFGRHPRLEGRLSALTHSAWKRYKRMKG